MPIDTRHPAMAYHLSDWEMIRDCIAGERAVKTAGIKYLPSLGGQDPKEYEAYVNRGSFYNATARTVQGLTGAVMRVDPKIEVPGELEDVLPFFTQTGLTFDEVARECADKVISFGYFGVLVGMDATGEGLPYAALYEPLSILNMSAQVRRGKQILTRVILQESIETPDEKDPYVLKNVMQIRELLLDPSGHLVCNIWKKDKNGTWLIAETTNPSVRGKAVDCITFVPFGAVTNQALPGRSPILDLVNVNLTHWRVNVDYHHGLHWCALPTPWATGFDADEKISLGPVRVIKSSNEGAHVGLLEFTGQGLGAVEKALDRLEQHMGILGAKLLQGPRVGVEAAETARINQSGESATLKTISSASGQGLVNVLKLMAMWKGAKPDGITVGMNMEFVSERLSAQDIAALVQARQAGEISRDTFLYNLAMGQILPKDRKIEDEKDLIEQEAPTPGRGGGLGEGEGAVE